MDLLDFFVCYPAGRALQEANRNSNALAKRMGLLNRKRKSELESLRMMVAGLMLVVETQHRLMVRKGLSTEAEFEALLREVDAEDGRIDGQRTR